MIQKSKLFSTLFFDIETTTRYKTFEEYLEKEPFNAKDFIYRASLKYPNVTPEFAYQEYGMLYPEHGQVVSIAWKIYSEKKFEGETFGFKDWDEYDGMDKKYADKEILLKFNRVLGNLFGNIDAPLGGYRVKYFDIPFVYKRMLVNKIYPHRSLIPVGKKPWEVPHIDLYDYWNVGVNGMSGFGTICDLMGVENPKMGEMDGRQVCYRFWDDHDTESINEYCMRDVDSSLRVAWEMTEDKMESSYKKTLDEWAAKGMDDIFDVESTIQESNNE